MDITADIGNKFRINADSQNDKNESRPLQPGSLVLIYSDLSLVDVTPDPSDATIHHIQLKSPGVLSISGTAKNANGDDISSSESINFTIQAPPPPPPPPPQEATHIVLTATPE